MKRTYHLLLLLVSCLSTFSTNAQCEPHRYQAPIFSEIVKHANVKYGEAPVWSIPYNNTDLYMDIFVPEDDTLSKRPLMIWVHPGGFLVGDKSADDMVALCDSFARRGYVTATIGYRLGFNPTSSASGERAVYRGVQDLRAAIRFLKEHHLDYGIDTNYTFLGGSSAGGFAVLHTAYLDQDEVPTSAYGGIASPDLGCLDCTGNNYQHGMNLSGIVNLWGAIGDSTWITAEETVPALLIHGTEDAVVPYGVGHPFGVFTTPLTHGSRAVSNQLTHLGIPHTLITFQGAGHEPHGTDNGTFNSAPTPYWDTIFTAIEAHFFSVLKPSVFAEGPNSVCEGDTLQFFFSSQDAIALCDVNFTGDYLHFEEGILKLVWNDLGEQSFAIQFVSSTGAASDTYSFTVEVKEKPLADFTVGGNAPTFSFTPNQTGNVNYIWNFGDGNASSNFSPTHTYTAEGSYEVKLTTKAPNNCLQTNTEVIAVSWLSTAENNTPDFYKVYPNPFSSELNLVSNEKWEELLLIDLTGKVLLRKVDFQPVYTIDTQELAPGMYVLRFISPTNATLNTTLIKR